MTHIYSQKIMNEKRFELKLSKLLCFPVFFSVLFFRETELLLAYTAAFLHELSHGLAAAALGIHPLGARCTVFGMRLIIVPITSSVRKLIIIFSGPAASFVIFAILYFVGRVFNISNPMYQFFCCANFFIGLINFLPVFPLDGAIIVRTFLSAIMGIIRGRTVFRWISASFLGVGVWINYLCLLKGIINPSFVMMLIFLILGIKDEKTYSLVEKKAVLAGEVIPGAKIRYLACDARSELLCLAEYISYDYHLLVAAFDGERFAGELCQSEITDGIKNLGALCTVEEYMKKRAEASLRGFDIKDGI